MIIRRAKRLQGEIQLPGDKSISHRTAMLAAIADGETRVSNYASSADCQSTLDCLRQLGIDIERSGTDVTVQGRGLSGLRPSVEPLDCGNSGTTMRLMAGVLAGQGFDTVMTGDESLRSRPMRRVIEPLERMGAEIESTDGRAPIRIHGRESLRAIEYRLPVASAQIKSCVLLAGLKSEGETAVVEPVATRDHTERMLRWFGVDVNESVSEAGRRISVNGGSRLAPSGEFRVPGDISSAAFFIVAAAALTGSEVVIKDVGLNPTRSGLIATMRELGAEIEVPDVRQTSNEPIGDIRVTGGLRQTGPGVVSGDVIANVIDELPILGVLGTQMESGLTVRDAAELRVKESDRIAAVCENLRRMHADVEEFDDGFRVGRSSLVGSKIDSYGDHRIAMAFAIAGLLAEGETEIAGSECAGVSFPNFFDVIKSVVIYK